VTPISFLQPPVAVLQWGLSVVVLPRSVALGQAVAARPATDLVER